jgi:hypothetical protein
MTTGDVAAFGALFYVANLEVGILCDWAQQKIRGAVMPHRLAVFVLLMFLLSVTVSADPIDEYIGAGGKDAYKGAKMFAWCSAHYQLAAMIASTDGGIDKNPAVIAEYKGTALGATMSGAFLLWLERAEKVFNGTARMDGVNRDLKYFSDMVDEWAKGNVQSLLARLESAKASNDQSEFQQVEKEALLGLDRCMSATIELQKGLIEGMREQVATQ